MSREEHLPWFVRGARGVQDVLTAICSLGFIEGLVLVVGRLLGLILVVSVPIGVLYFLIRFIKWAWQD